MGNKVSVVAGNDSKSSDKHINISDFKNENEITMNSDNTIQSNNEILDDANNEKYYYYEDEENEDERKKRIRSKKNFLERYIEDNNIEAEMKEYKDYIIPKVQFWTVASSIWGGKYLVNTHSLKIVYMCIHDR